MKALKVAILHRSVITGDAIGNDILGSYSLLERMGLLPEIVCEFYQEEILVDYRVKSDMNAARIRSAYDLLMYHHSVNWTDGETIIDAFSGPIVIKYHNITPAKFFTPYSQLYESVCELGREQTKRFAHGGKVTLWLSDSAYNALELSTIGVKSSDNVVVPPFTRADELFHIKNLAKYKPGECVDLLFVGRLAPNKGHHHLLQIISSYITLYSTDVRLSIVGAADIQLSEYSDQLPYLCEQLGITPHITWLSNISDRQLDGLLGTSHAYINASEHEGFCVPIVEAQSIGLPVITVDSTALAETTGTNQIICPLPRNDEGYDLIAGLIHEVVTNSSLRENLIHHGFKNTYERFSQEIIENLFVGSLEPILRELS